VNNPTEQHNAIVIPENEHPTEGHEELTISMTMQKVFSGFPTHKPTKEEYLATPMGRRITLTSEDLEWDPENNEAFQDGEHAMLKPDGTLRDEPWSNARIVAAISTMKPEHAMFEPSSLGTALTHHANRSVNAILSTDRQYKVQPAELAKKWNIGIKTAESTYNATTQRGIRILGKPNMSRRFRTNDRQLRYRRLSHDVFSDTLEAKTQSWFRKNRYAQVFSTSFQFVRAYPMKAKSDAHHALDLFAHQVGAPPSLIMDGSKEQQMGEFRRKARAMGTRVKQLEPYAPWSNAAEGGIREAKRGSGRKAMKAQSPAKLWDHCIELECLIRSHTAIDHHELQGQVPETIMTGQTADISPLVEHEWYEWVKFWDVRSGYPDLKEVLGRWLGPSIDIGPAMCSKILKQNGQIAYTSSFRGLTADEMHDLHP
jgi:hypothetical protein